MPITIERRERAFKEALSFQAFVDSMKVNREIFLANYDAYQLSEADQAFFAALPEPIEVLILAHDWCGDVVANTPLFGKIERETGKLHLHLLPRDPDNTDIAAAYPHSDGHNHIPTYIFYNQAGEELGVFIERPDEITSLLKGWFDDFYEANPQLEGRGLPLNQLPTSTRDQLLAYLKKRRSEIVPLEQEVVLTAIKPILEGAFKKEVAAVR